MSRPLGGTHIGTHEDRGCEKAGPGSRCLACPFPVCAEDTPDRGGRPRRRAVMNEVARYVQCSCGLTETMTFWNGVPNLKRAFQLRHAGHQLRTHGAPMREDIALVSSWNVEQPHFQRKAQPGRRR